MSINQTLSRTILTSGLTFLTFSHCVVRWSSVARLFAGAGDWYHCRNLLVGLHRESHGDLVPAIGSRAGSGTQRMLHLRAARVGGYGEEREVRRRPENEF
jgi:hypothetical protein